MALEEKTEKKADCFWYYDLRKNYPDLIGSPKIKCYLCEGKGFYKGKKCDIYLSLIEVKEMKRKNELKAKENGKF